MKRLIKYIVLFVSLALLVWGIMWSRGKANDEVCTDVDIIVLNADSSSLVTPQGIKNEMTSLGLKVVGIAVNKINTDLIEKKLKESEYLETVDCVIGANGHVIIRVKQIVPVLRVFENDSTSYYVNHDGKPMRASANFSANVPIATGNFTKAYPVTRILPMVEYIEKNKLLKSLVTMVNVRDSNNVFIVPSISGHVVNMGSVDNYENKLTKLCAFYKNVLPYKGYEYYDTISVKWDHQVVATRRKKAVENIAVEIDTTQTNDDLAFDVIADAPPMPESKNNQPGKAKAPAKPKQPQAATPATKK